MSNKLTILCQTELATGFRLAGIEATAISKGAEVEPILLEKLRNGSSEVVIIDETFKQSISDDLNARLRESFTPLFVYLPLVSKRGNQDLKRYVHDYVSNLIQAAVGKKLAIPM